MSRLARLVFVFLVAALTLLAPRAASAQGSSYEIQVYASELVPVRRTMIEFHSNFTPMGLRDPADGTQPTDHAFHETLEVTHGFTEWLEVGSYVFTSARSGDGWGYVGSHLRPRVTVPTRWHWPVGVSVSQEIGFQHRRFSTDTWTWEIRPIVDQQVGRLYWAVNLAFEKTLQGENVHGGFDLSAAGKISVDVTRRVALGAEYYGGLGSVRHVSPGGQQHQIFPTLDLNLSPDWEFNFGVGIGLTSVTDKLIVKMIVGRRLRF